MLKPPVDADIYRAVANATSPDFAFSYLMKASQIGSVITPHTKMAWTRLMENREAMRALGIHRVKLQQPQNWHPGRDQPAEMARAA